MACMVMDWTLGLKNSQGRFLGWGLEWPSSETRNIEEWIAEGSECRVGQVEFRVGHSMCVGQVSSVFSSSDAQS